MKNRGVTLIELLIAIILTGIATMITIGMLSQESSHYQRTREKVKMQATTRDALRILDEEIRNAGYQTVVTATSRVHATPQRCPEVVYSSAGESIKTGLQHSTIDSGDELQFRFYELPASGVLTSCGIGVGSQFREIAYRLRNGRIERQYRTDTTTAASWIPFVENIVSFQVNYGMLSTPMDTPVGFSDASFSDPANWIGIDLTVGGTPGNITVSDFTGNKTSSMIYKTGIPNHIAGSIYRISFDGTPNAAMIDPVNGTDSDFTNISMCYYPPLTVQKGPYNFMMSNLANTPLHHQLYVTGPGSTSAYRPAFRWKLSSGKDPWQGQKFTISNLKIRRVMAARYTWLNNPTPEQMAQVGAIRITVLAKTSQNAQEPTAASFTGAQLGDTTFTYTASGPDATKAHILYDRVIPVVNNALQNQP